MREELAQRLARGERVALATVVATRRSAPRPVGSKLVVSETGELSGSVSGGCVEGDVAVQAAEVIEDGGPRLLTYGISDDQAWSVGLPCGGEIDVFVERFEGELPDPAVPAVALTVLGGERAGERRVVEPSEVAPGPSRVLELDGDRVFAEVLGPPPRVVVVGAIDTAEELCRAAKALGWRTAVVDPRPALATRERLPSPDELVVAWPDEGLCQLHVAPDDAVVVLTHEERLDVPALNASTWGIRTETATSTCSAVAGCSTSGATTRASARHLSRRWRWSGPARRSSASTCCPPCSPRSCCAARRLRSERRCSRAPAPSRSRPRSSWGARQPDPHVSPPPSTASTGSRSARSRRTRRRSSRTGSDRCCPASSRFRSTTSTRWRASSPVRTSRSSSSSRCRARASTSRPTATSKARRPCVAATGRSSASTRCRPASAAPAGCSRSSTGASSPT